MSEPLYKFRLHIRNKDFNMKGYFLVQIWQTKQEMEEHTQYKGQHSITIFPYTPSGKPSKTCKLNFWTRRLGIEYTTHEILHAVLEWARINQLNFQTYEDKFYRDEEIFVQVFAELTKQFYKKLYKLGLTEQFDFVESREFRKK